MLTIDIHPQPEDPNGHKWRCTVNEGPGHHGTGRSKAEATHNAALAWLIWTNDKELERE